jgi:hypothetical protein
MGELATNFDSSSGMNVCLVLELHSTNFGTKLKFVIRWYIKALVFYLWYLLLMFVGVTLIS